MDKVWHERELNWTVNSGGISFDTILNLLAAKGYVSKPHYFAGTINFDEYFETPKDISLRMRRSERIDGLPHQPRYANSVRCVYKKGESTNSRTTNGIVLQNDKDLMKNFCVFAAENGLEIDENAKPVLSLKQNCPFKLVEKDGAVYNIAFQDVTYEKDGRKISEQNLSVELHEATAAEQEQKHLAEIEDLINGSGLDLTQFNESKYQRGTRLFAELAAGRDVKFVRPRGGEITNNCT